MNRDSYIKYFFTIICFQTLFILFPQVLKSQTPSWVWAKGIETSTAEWANDIATDPSSGDVVAVGVFNSDLSGFFGGNFLGLTGGGFVVKYDAAGNVIWAFNIGNNQDDACNGVTISSLGNIYVTGYFQNVTDFKGTNLFSTLLLPTGGKDVFLAKYNSVGQLQWVRKGGGSFDDEGLAVSCNTTDIFVTGYFNNSGSFDGIPTGSNYSNENMFVASYDANGNINWESDAGSGNACFGRDITADNNGIYVTGDFKNSSLDMYDNVGGYAGSVLNAVGTKEDAFVMSLSLTGGFLWGKGIHSANADFGRGVAQSGNNIYITGSTSSSANFPGYTSNPVGITAAGLDLYVAQLSKISGTTNWVNSEPGSNNEEGTAIAIDTSNTICVAGYFQSTLSFSGGPTITSSGNEDIFVSNYSISGNFNWAAQAGANGTDIPHSVATNSAGDVYTAGEYENNAVFGTTILTADSPPNIFVAKIGCAPISNNSISSAQTICANQIPATLNGSTPSGGSGTYTYLWEQSSDNFIWSNAGGTNNTQNYSSPALSSNTYYRRTVSCGGNCSGTLTSASILITVNPLPNVNANTTTTKVCTGGTVTLTGSGATSYTWTNSVSDGVSFTPSSSQTYTVTGTDGNGCVNSDTITVSLNPSPTVTANTTTTTVCSGGSVTLTGGGASTYTWTGGVTNGVSFSPASTQTYTVIGTDSNGCTNFATKTITVNPSPTVTANATTTSVCLGGTVTLTGGGALTYTWTGGISNGVSFSPSATQTYTVTGTDGTGCTNSATKLITVNPLPTVTANATATTVCTGGAVTLTGGGASTYTWTAGITNGVSFVPSSTQTYTVTGTDSNGCINSAAKTITVNPSPSVTANATALIICEGATVTLTGSGASTYTWTGGVTNGVSFSPTATQTYTVTGTDVNGCTNSATKTITVIPLPFVTANATANTVCTGGPVTLTGGGATTYTWTSGVTDGVSFVPLSTQTYTVTGTDGNGCTNSAVKTITVNPLPTVTANATAAAVCTGGTVTLTGSGATTYTWTNGVTDGISFSPSSTQTYTVTGTDINGCTNSDTKIITVNSLPVVTANSTTTTVCLGNNITLTGSGAATYTWTSGVMNGISFTPSSTQTYTVTGTDINNCSNNATVTINVDILPSTSNAGTTQILCASTATLAAVSPTTGTGVWSVISGGASINSPSTNNSSVTGLSTGSNIFMWTVSNGICPSSTSTIAVNVDAMPTTAMAGNNQNLCNDSVASLSANNPTIGIGAWTIVSGSGTLSSASLNNTNVTGLTVGQSIFMWSVTNGTCPASTSTVSVAIDALPTTANAGTDVLVHSPNANLSGNVPVIGTGIWTQVSGGGSISSNTNPTTSLSNLQFGQNIFHWTISSGSCPASVDEVIVTVHELIVPNGFSPNGDGTNDTFEIPGLSEYSSTKLDVFNRWGNLVYQNHDYKNDWSGKNSGGEDLTDDTYYFTLDITGKKIYKGYVVLKRK